ncbi:hypothetical protein I6F26_34885 [Ensifer sp. IC3342]|nr:hypothetical protein [Ensifer sp. BRP08]MCA1451555.1 hypothetical protein [Ensifer sp. IC3342]
MTLLRRTRKAKRYERLLRKGRAETVGRPSRIEIGCKGGRILKVDACTTLKR